MIFGFVGVLLLLELQLCSAVLLLALILQVVMLHCVLLGSLGMLPIALLNCHVNALVTSDVRFAAGLGILIVATVMESLVC